MRRGGGGEGGIGGLSRGETVVLPAMEMRQSIPRTKSGKVPMRLPRGPRRCWRIRAISLRLSPLLSVCRSHFRKYLVVNHRLTLVSSLLPNTVTKPTIYAISPTQSVPTYASTTLILGVMLVGWRCAISAMEGDATIEQTRREAMQMRRERGVRICRRVRRCADVEGSITATGRKRRG